ncbi:hypothetical protein EaACW_2636 [Erwinia amylovora ACW56400]|uniref:Uncharacterized protein n=1 Tax=Erwinia amylovora ATCC BAA-2158 TaxID=889211 RepID=E5B7N6_ERWAM|nr:hypothetical protein EaACW_2636 [Erwinia amylovora ACW56400]CBX81491.1 hypothetical protein predicted by Glimmer/Critica [Erwinia amylovora ATCC BAA-2158]CCO79480.1 hypothetical protein BN432_2701 [Erwinia amylovora Ea356]CCO90840.1 hypothetical protein BN435_2688 [Erwinia amylovora 01SFR-BO]CCO99953.1 hypothetical protein BN438_2688 [Erwinia amylovora UPN527]
MPDIAPLQQQIATGSGETEQHIIPAAAAPPSG